MKTAISVPGPLFKRAERIAKRQRRSRSELYSTALAEYLNRHDDAEITRKLNEVYADVDSRLTPELTRQASRIVSREDW